MMKCLELYLILLILVILTGKFLLCNEYIYIMCNIILLIYTCIVHFLRTMIQHYSFVLTNIESKWTFGFCRHDPKSETALVVLSYLPWHESFYK